MASTFSSISSSFNLIETLRYRPPFPRSTSSPKLYKHTMPTTLTAQNTMEAQLQSHILKSLPKTPPLAVKEPMKHLIETAPTTISPTLCLVACELVSGNRETAMNVASAMHLMHAASYAHDQLPALNSSRANVLSSSQFSSASMLLSHMGIFSFAFELMGNSTCCKPEHLVRVFAEISESVGANGVIRGQYIEAKNARLRDDLDELICENREGKLAGCAAACGAVVGGSSDDEVEKFRRFGFNVGMMHGLVKLEGKNEEALMFRSLAMLEIENMKNFGEDKVEMMMKLVDLWYGEGKKNLLLVN